DLCRKTGCGPLGRRRVLLFRAYLAISRGMAFKSACRANSEPCVLTAGDAQLHDGPEEDPQPASQVVDRYPLVDPVDPFRFAVIELKRDVPVRNHSLRPEVLAVCPARCQVRDNDGFRSLAR